MLKLKGTNELLDINIKYGAHMPKIHINLNENELLTSIKNNIDNLDLDTSWDKFKKLTNPYELVHTPKKRRKDKNQSIARYLPFSRSYFKMWEIIYEFELINNSKTINVSHIAEGPGGFMESVINYRKRFNKKDNIYGITLRSTKKFIPGWNKSKDFIKRNNIIISYGKDNTGDICNIENIIFFKNQIGNNKCDLVTADGGFDFSIDFNHQEQQAFQLIFCEIVLALSVQKNGGSFVLKIFDMFTLLTIKMLYIISYFYEEVYIYKPLTSRCANSEKYIIAKKFRGIEKTYLNKLYGIIKLWDSIEKNNYYILDLFSDISNKKFIEQIININKKYIKKQIKSIKDTFKLINDRPDVKTYNNIIKNQVNNAITWCNKYNIKINDNSKYLLLK